MGLLVVIFPGGAVVGRTISSIGHQFMGFSAFDPHMAKSFQCISLRADEETQWSAAVGAYKMLFELLLVPKCTMKLPKQVVLVGDIDRATPGLVAMTH